MTHHILKSAGVLVLSLALSCTAAADQAGDDSRKQATAKVVSSQVMEVKKAPVVVPAGAGELSKALQGALENGDPVRVEGSPGRLTAAPGDGLRYTCNGGNCACAGAADCVDMISNDKKCQDGTVGCNDYGCTCKEGEGG